MKKRSYLSTMIIALAAISLAHAAKPKTCDRDEVGFSVENRPIVMSAFGAGADVVLFIGCVHGDERIGKELLTMLHQRLCANPNLYADKRVLIIPVANPDGFILKTRGNARGVDLNRNFPTKDWSKDAPDERYYPGQFPASEPETQALIKIIEKENPRLIVTIHQPFECVNYDGPAMELAKKLVEATGLPLSDSVGYDTPGSLGTYAGAERKIPIITIELSWKVKRYELSDKYLPALLKVIGTL